MEFGCGCVRARSQFFMYLNACVYSQMNFKCSVNNEHVRCVYTVHTNGIASAPKWNAIENCENLLHFVFNRCGGGENPERRTDVRVSVCVCVCVPNEWEKKASRKKKVIILCTTYTCSRYPKAKFYRAVPLKLKFRLLCSFSSFHSFRRISVWRFEPITVRTRTRARTRVRARARAQQRRANIQLCARLLNRNNN